MIDKTISILGLRIPSSKPAFLGIVAVHVATALACLVAGIGAIFTGKGSKRHRIYGRTYYRFLFVVAFTAAILAIVRWEQDYYLLILGVLSFTAAFLGRRALLHRWRNWTAIHIVGMGGSFILLLTAFYVDNGKNLPVWKHLPVVLYWLLPGAVGMPLIIRALRKHPTSRYARGLRPVQK